MAHFEFVEVRSSPIDGLGVFARRIIAKGTLLGMYEGEVLSAEEFAKRYPLDDSKYVLDIGGNTFIDAVDPQKSNFSRYINSPRGTRKKPNVSFVDNGKILSLKKIEKDEEILVSYGSTYYWK